MYEIVCVNKVIRGRYNDLREVPPPHLINSEASLRDGSEFPFKGRCCLRGGGHIIFWPLSWGGQYFWASVKRVPSIIFVHSEVAGYLSLCQWQLLSPKALKTPFSCVMLLRSVNSKNQTSVKKISVPVPTIPVNSGISLSSVHFTYYIETCFESNGCIIL